MVIGVVGWGSVRGREGGDWRGGRASPVKDSVDILRLGESLSAGVAVCRGVVNGLSSTIDLRDPFSSMSFIDSSERLRSLSFCSSPLFVMLIELFCDVDNGPWRLPPPPWNGESVWGSSYWELWCRLCGLLWGWGSCRDPYGFVPVYDGGIFCGGSMGWVFWLGKVGSVGNIEVIPDEVELSGGADVDVMGVIGDRANCGIPRTTAGRWLGDGGACWACCPQAESNEVSGQVCGSGIV